MKKIRLKYLLFFVIVILSSVVFLNAFFATEKNYIKSDLPNATDTFDYEGAYTLTQSIEADKNFCGITIKLSPPVLKNKTISVTISSPDGEMLVTKIFDSKSDYSSPITVTFSNLFGRSAGTYSITITSDGTGAPVPLYFIGGEETAYLNGHDTDCSLSVAPIHSNRIAIVLFFTFLIGISLLILVVYILINSLSLGRENAFLVSVCAFLALGMLIIPLGAGVQESSAFPAAYSLSDDSFFKATIDRDSDTPPVFTIPDSFESLLSDAPGYTPTVSILRNGIDSDGTISVSAKKSDMLSSLSFAPAALGITVGEFFSNNPVIIFYFARIFSVLFAVMLLFMTIKIIPWGKQIFFVICLNPAVISLLCTVSSFSVPLLFSFLFFALVMNIKNSDGSITIKKIIVLSVVAIITAASSIITIPSVLLSLIVLKRERFSSASIYLSALLGTLILPLAIGIARVTVFCVTDPTSMEFTSIITTDMGAFFKKFFYELKETSSETVLAIFGKRVTANGVVISGGLSSIVIMFLTFIAAALDRNLKEQFSRRSKAVLLVYGSVSAIFALGGEYIGSGFDLLSPANALGCYFIPMLLPLLFLLGDNGIIYNTDKNSRRLRDCVCSIGMFPFAFYMLSTVIHYI